MDRATLFAQWVEQPPADPIVQYLRDAEREAALDLLGKRESVLDVASETGVTRNIDADRVTRVDFSSPASERAEEVLGTAVDRYEVIGYRNPALPFDTDSFDGAVSVGPYDWRFLDVEGLTAEIHRVLRAGGRFVPTVPTPRSPYADGARNRLRYYEPAAAERLLGPRWRRPRRRLVYQLPGRLHQVAQRLPNRLQQPFVEYSRRESERLTEENAAQDASYIVLAGEPVDYEGYLDSALAALFRPVADDGFWDPRERRLVRGLRYERTADGLRWSRDTDHQWRYPPFALMGLLQWRGSSLGDDRYDGMLADALSFVEREIDDGVLPEIPSYGLGALLVAFSRAATALDASFAAPAERIAAHTRDRVAFEHAEDSLVLYGLTYLYELNGSDALRDRIEDGIWEVAERQEPGSSLFVFDNPTTRRHQNQMYTLWGLCRAIEVTGMDGYLDNARRALRYAVTERMRDDGAFRWGDATPRDRLREAVRRRLGLGQTYWRCLFPCHQTFFVTAAHHYREAGGTVPYDVPVRRAMDWVYRTNARGENLVESSGIGVPMRVMDVDGRLDLPDQQFKGTYEVGAYLMALTALLEW